MIRVPPMALALLLAAYLVPLAAPAALMEDDEGLHAAIAQEMVERGDWTVPRLLGEPFLDKPVLYFWLQAASIATFGSTEFAVRLPGTLVALAGAVATGWLAFAMFGPGVGVWSALIYATMLLPYGVSLAPLHDLVMVPLVTVAIGAYWHARYAPSIAALGRWTLLAGLAVGLSMLGKGLTGVGLAGVGVAAWLVWTRGLSWRLVAAAAVSLAIAAALAWPWYAAMERAVPGYLEYFFAERHLAGVTDDTQRHAGRPIWYYLPIVLAGSLPWGIVLWRRVRPASDAERLLWAWLVADFIVLSLAGSKLATYLLPALPAVAVLAARRLAGDQDERSLTVTTIRTAGAVSAVLGLVAVAAAAWWTRLPMSQAAWIWSLLPVATWLWTTRTRVAAAVQVLAVTTTALLAVAAGVVPTVAERLTAEMLARRINDLNHLPRRLLIVDEGIGSFLFYLRPDLRREATAGRVARVSRFSLADVSDRDGVVVAVAADRLPGVAELYDVGRPAALFDAAFLVEPIDQFRPRSASR